MKLNNITINNCRFKTYLIGSMEAPGKTDGGVFWRKELTPRLNKLGIYCFDPTIEELAKVGLPANEFINMLTDLVENQELEKFVIEMEKIWYGVDVEDGHNFKHIFGDIDYVRNSRFLIWNLDEGDKPGGTIIELATAYLSGIPVYLITQVPLAKINKSLLYFVLASGQKTGRIFNNQDSLIAYIKKQYKL